MLNFIKTLFKPKYNTLNLVQIKAQNIIDNYNYLKSIQESVEIFPVLKSNAYGHGLKELSLILNKTDAKMVAVDSFPEAQIALKNFKGKVLIIGEMPLKAYHYCNFKRTEFVVYNEQTLQHLSRFGKKIKVHLFVNTGMNREGIQNIEEFIVNNKKYLDEVEVSGICSHLASAGRESDLNKKQEERFIEAVEIIRKNGYFPQWIHLGNSAALFLMENKILTAFRPGLSLYGYRPTDIIDEADLLKPALDVYSHVISIQNIKAGDSVSYDETYIADHNTTIATIPFGYFEGLNRLLSNKVKLLFQHEKEQFWAPIAGNVCMNLTSCDVSDNEVELGDVVKVISSNKEDDNSIENLAKLSYTIPYEFLVKIQGNIRRNIDWR